MSPSTASTIIAVILSTSSFLVLLGSSPVAAAGEEPTIVDFMNDINADLESAGPTFQIESASLYVSVGDATPKQMGKISFFSDVGNKLIAPQWDP
jgi:hypothetical protein